jgi:hypothetical protein
VPNSRPRILFLRKQLALYQERKGKPRRADDATRIVLAGLSRFLAWRQLTGHREARDADPLASTGIPTVLALEVTAPGRPAISPDVQQLIATMAAANRTWGEERIANGLLAEAGIGCRRGTVRRYMPSRPRRPRPSNAGMEHVRAEPCPVGPRE